jgi:hypothetical protein
MSTATQFVLGFQTSIKPIYVRSRSLKVASASLSMLRRLLSLSFLYAAIVLAGVPAAACANAMPAQHCCPSAPGMPCRGGTPEAPRGMPTELVCCASGIPVGTAIAATAASPKIERHAPRIDPPAAISAYPSPTIVGARSYSSVRLDLVFRPLSYSGLYLSTGRLRL